MPRPTTFHRFGPIVAFAPGFVTWQTAHWRNRLFPLPESAVASRASMGAIVDSAKTGPESKIADNTMATKVPQTAMA